MQKINVLSFGSGTQSTALLLLAAEQKIHVDLIVFADTGAEPYEVYEHLKICQGIAKKVNIPFLITKTDVSLEEVVINASENNTKLATPCYT